MKVKLVVISIILIIAGFGLIHTGKPAIEYTGSALIGIPAVYLLYVLFNTYFRQSDTDNNKSNQI